MKMILFIVTSYLALQSGQGAPTTAVYKFVKCNPEGNQANCVTQESPVMEWTPDLPNKLPAATALYLEALPVDEKEEESQMISEENESPDYYWPEDGSGDYEGSAGPFLADLPVETAESESGSGEFWTEKNMELFKAGRADKDTRGFRRFLSSRRHEGAEQAEQELRDDHLLKL